MCNYVKLSNLANERLNAGLTVEDAAREIGITSQEWRSYENDPIRIPAHELIDMVYLFRVAGAYLLGLCDNPKTAVFS